MITGTDWLRVLRADPTPRHHLVCFPPGGASVTAYRELAARFGAGAAVVGVQYPGRQDRLGESVVSDLSELADAIAAQLLGQGPHTGLSLFGHSMGATVAFETARRLERAGQPVRMLFVSGRPAPTFDDPGRLHLGSDDELTRWPFLSGRARRRRRRPHRRAARARSVSPSVVPRRRRSSRMYPDHDTTTQSATSARTKPSALSG